ncbi:MAG: sialate O-acetylesterase [Methylacidiphilales bacterium]|nr:sialate O-acetylesterase [Candidatus Methylacidiphilales bacterium]
MNFKLNLRSLALFSGLMVTVFPVSGFGDVSLPSFFSDGAVLQRDTVAPVWGTAAPNEAVTLELNGQTTSATAGQDGKWCATFKGLAAGGPFTLTVKGTSNSVTVQNVLVGDVWLCSGQSNMSLHMYEIADVAQGDIAAADDPLLHCFTVSSTAADNVPVPPYEGKWESTDPDSVKGYSAVAYYFAKELREQVKVPIGIIHCSYPGTCGESWVRKEALAGLGLGPQEAAVAQSWNNADQTTQKFLSDLNDWETKMGRQDPGNKGYAQGWADPKTDVSTWTTLPTPGDWTSLGLVNGGVVWIRKTVNFPDQGKVKDFTLQLGNLQNFGKESGNVLGTVYFNNQEVGEIGHVLKHIFTRPGDQLVKVPGSLIVHGANVVAVRIFTQEEKGPLFGGGTGLIRAPFPFTMRVEPQWQAKVEAQLPPAPPDAAFTRPPTPNIPIMTRRPSLMFDSMLSPLVGYGMKGAAWYQGEGNADRGEAYGSLLRGLIADWRGLWKQGDFPFYIVQLANISPPANDPNGKSGLAAVREGQLQTWQRVAHTGLAVTIDVGDANNIHYHNKKEVGHRLALIALAQTYGQKIEFSGPVIDSMAVEGNTIRLKFTHIGGGLVAKGGPLQQFVIAGADQKFVWADATIDGDTVLVSSKDVAAPVAVRYAWADNPAGCNLYNKEDLPASPFRTDDWPLSTAGK